VAEYVALSRPLICQPDLIAHWQSAGRRSSSCTSCNECFYRGFRGEGVVCIRSTRA
jgi:2,4-dienoyl-CoA reductase-like NADH-dependent reductase (Old Yellow Enzyme family)